MPTMKHTSGFGKGKPGRSLSRKPSASVQANGYDGSGHGQYEIDAPAPPQILPPGKGYAVPSMDIVRKSAEQARFRVASFFAGCGGSSVGLKLAGFRVIYANEFWDVAARTYAANHKITPDTRSIVDVRPEDVLAACGVRKGELDLMDGSPPCQTFSTAGRRDMSDDRTDLFDEWIRILRGVMPRAFVAENVAGMVKGVAKGKFKEVLREMRASGYDVQARILDAQWLGVPQQRQRTIFIGFRSDLKIDPATAFPTPNKKNISVSDACPWIAYGIEDTGGQFSQGKFTSKAPCVRKSGVGQLYAVEVVQLEISGQIPNELRLDKSREALCDSDKRFGVNQRARTGKPCPTTTTFSHNLVHPTERRKFTIAELKRIQSFPDDFNLEPAGSYAKQWAVVGNSVPPLMMKRIAEGIARALTKRKEMKCIRKG